MSIATSCNPCFNPAVFNAAIGNGASAASAMSRSGASPAPTLQASFALRLAEFKSQTLGTLMGATSGVANSEGPTDISALLGAQGASATDGGSNGLSATGRNTALFDSESAYRMMSVINTAGITYKAQFAELSQMQSWLVEMQHDAESLGGISAATDNASIASQLQTFASQYNAWVKRFDADMAKGGLLANTQAAQVSRYELEQSIQNIFNGAAAGLHGLRDIGFSIDPVSKLAVVDTAKLDAVLASNKAGAVDALQSFSAQFARAAELLDADGNFVPNQLKNLSRAIHYIDDNTSSLQAEFGMGDAAKPSAQVAQALAAYKGTYSI